MACSPRANASRSRSTSGCGKERHALLVGPGRLAPQVHDRNRRQRPRGDAFGQRQARQAPAVGGVDGLDRRGRGPEDERRGVLSRAQRDHVAGVVAGRFALLVGGVVLLVDDEEAGVGHGREGRRAGADDGERVARANPVPGLGPLSLREGRVQHGRALGELPPELAGEDRGERDLRHEPDRAAPGVERRANRRADRPPSCRCRSRPGGAPGSSGAPGSPRRGPAKRRPGAP